MTEDERHAEMIKSLDRIWGALAFVTVAIFTVGIIIANILRDQL